MRLLNSVLSAVLVLLLFVVISGCAMFDGGRSDMRISYLHILNLPSWDNGFVRGFQFDSAHTVLVAPKELAVINEFPSSSSSYSTRVFTAAPLRLAVSDRHGLNPPSQVYQLIEDKKFVVEVHNSASIQGLPKNIEANTMAILRFVGEGTMSYSWEIIPIETDKNIFRLVLRVNDGDWVCSSVPSASITRVQEGQRIKRMP